MSYIMEALKRAAEEREAGLAAVRPPARHAGIRRWPWWAVTIVAALGLNAAVLALVLLPSRVGVGPEPGTGSSGATSGAPGPTVAVGPDRPPRPVEAMSGTGRAEALRPRPVLTERDVSAAGGGARSATARSAGTVASTRRERSEPGKTAESSPSSSTPATPSGSPSPPGTATRPEPETAPAPSAASTPAPPGEDASRLSEVAARLKLEVLVYAPAAAERLAFINGKRYVEGQTVEGDLVVETITEEGVILVGQGRQFLLRPPQR